MFSIYRKARSMEFAISSWPAFALNRLILLVEQCLIAGAIVLVTFIIMYFFHLSKMF